MNIGLKVALGFGICVVIFGIGLISYMIIESQGCETNYDKHVGCEYYKCISEIDGSNKEDYTNCLLEEQNKLLRVN